MYIFVPICLLLTQYNKSEHRIGRIFTINGSWIQFVYAMAFYYHTARRISTYFSIVSVVQTPCYINTHLEPLSDCYPSFCLTDKGGTKHQILKLSYF